jgi:hypothetical protein
LSAVGLSRRVMWLWASIALAWAIVIIPGLFSVTIKRSDIVLLVQLIVCGVMLGSGRQGIDVLVLRVIASSVSFVLAVQLQSHGPCTGLLNCFQYVILGTTIFGGTASVVMTMLAIPTTVLWSRGFTSLRPELPPWLLIVLAVVLVVALAFSVALSVLFVWSTYGSPS